MPKSWVLHHTEDPVSEHQSVVMFQNMTGSCFESKSPRLMTSYMTMESYLKNNLKLSHLFLTNKIKDDSIKTNTWNTSLFRCAHPNTVGNTDVALPFYTFKL